MARAQVNTYRGASFNTLFVDYEKVSGKPLLLGEYGIDAFNSVSLQEDTDVRPPSPTQRAIPPHPWAFAEARGWLSA